MKQRPKEKEKMSHSLASVVNQAPIITSDCGGATASVNVQENQTAVTTVTASDADVPADTLTFSISGGADQALFNINPTWYRLAKPRGEGPAP